MSQLNDSSEKLSSRSEARKLNSNKLEFANNKAGNRTTRLLDKDSINKSAPENKSKSFEEHSGSSPYLDDDINSGGHRKRPLAMHQVANQEGEGIKMKLRKGSFGDSNNQEGCHAEARCVISKESSAPSKGLNGTLDTTKAKLNDTISQYKGGNIAARTDVCDDRRYLKYDDQKIGKHVSDSAESCDSEAENKSTNDCKRASSKRCVPIEYNSADQHDSNIKTTKAISSKVKAHDETKSCGKSKVDAKYSKDIKVDAGSIDELTVPRNSSPKYNKGGARSKNESSKSSLHNIKRISVPKESASSDTETRRHYDEDSCEVRKASDISNSQIPVCDSDSDRSSSSSSIRSSRSGGNSGSGSNRPRSNNSGSNSSGSDSSRGNNSRSNSSGSNSSRSSNSRSNSARSCNNSSNVRSSRNGSQSDLEAGGYNTRKNKTNHVIKSEKLAKGVGTSYHPNHSEPIGPNVHLEYEWQYRDDQGGWVTYGQSGGNAPGSKMVTSEDIEKYYTEDPDKTPLLIEFDNNKYILDFQKMKQTSQRTAYQRDIRCILKLPENKSSSQNRGGHSGSRAASGRNNTSGGRYGVDYPLNAGDGRANRRMRYDNNTPAETNAGRGYAGNSVQGRDGPSVTYEWQFRDKHGKWIAYGNANTFFDKSNATTSRSEDIEKAYSNKNMPYFVIESSRHSYILNFEQMVQTNNQTEVKRPIRRVVKYSSKKESVAESVGKFFGNLTGQKQNKKNKKEFITPYEWQFQDEHGVWITYGQANSAGNVVCTTNTTSDDIEKYLSSGSHKHRMTINSTHNTYSLDFNCMTQTNTRTSIQRPIRRVLKNDRNISEPKHNRNTTKVSLYANLGYNSAYVAPGKPTNKSASTANHGNNKAYVAPGRPPNESASTHLWQFEDERGQWITYGESCSTVTGSGTTTAATDDIEEYYLKNNGEMPMFVSNKYNDYILDFKSMCQTNQSTSVQRRIQRITKPNEIVRNHRR